MIESTGRGLQKMNPDTLRFAAMELQKMNPDTLKFAAMEESGASFTV